MLYSQKIDHTATNFSSHVRTFDSFDFLTHTIGCALLALTLAITLILVRTLRGVGWSAGTMCCSRATRNNKFGLWVRHDDRRQPVAGGVGEVRIRFSAQLRRSSTSSSELPKSRARKRELGAGAEPVDGGEATTNYLFSRVLLHT